MKRLIGAAIALGLSACASKPADTTSVVTQRAHDETVEILLARRNREPASVRDAMGAQLTDLNRVRPGKFEVYVFPKISNQNLKRPGAVNESLGAPQVFDVSTVALSPCRAFIQGTLFAKLKPADMFDPSLASDPNRQCAIIEITSRRLATMNRALIRRDDILQVRLFVDENYRLYGTEHAIFDDAKRIRLVRMKNDPRSAAFSGLTLFPMDLPAQEGVATFAGDPGTMVSQRLGPEPIKRVRKNYNQAFSIPSCAGSLTQGRDDFGAPIYIGWCKGLPWAHFIDNSRFIAVTQPLTLR